jgi:hypothetical protein
MKRNPLVVVIAALAASAVFVGVGIAATKALSPKQENQAVLNDVAGQLGVSADKLSSALKQALKNRVDAAVKDGRLTKEQAARLKADIDAGDTPLFGFGPGGFHHHFDHDMQGLFHARLETAAKYLGLSESQLRNELAGGKTLAQVAKAHDKSVDGLISAMVDAAGQELDEAVKAGRMTEADKKEMLVGLEKRIADLVNGRFPRPMGPRFHRGGLGFRIERAPTF